MSHQTESRKALRELIQLLQEIDDRWAGPEWNLHNAEDIVGAHRALMHMLEGGLTGHYESQSSHPEFRRIVSPSRKFTGDNGDAIYFDAPLGEQYEYVVQGSMNGACYFSLTLEVGTAQGRMASKTDGVLNNTEMDIDADGAFEVHLGGQSRSGNWLPIPAGVTRVTTRHYFEFEHCAAADPHLEPKLQIRALNVDSAPRPPDDASVAAGMRRVAGFLRSRTLDQPPMAEAAQPPFVSLLPNEFPPPVVPGDFGLAAVDAHYSMAPYFLGEDDALLITGRWPECLFANVCLWNRFQQTFDYANRTVSLNRAQTALEPDGSFRMVIAHSDPGVPNWLDTEGQALGIVFWRFMLATGEVATPDASVVKLEDIRAG